MGLFFKLAALWGLGFGLAVSSASALAGSAAAFGQPMQLTEAKAGTLLVRGDDDLVTRPAPMLGTDVEITVTGLIARTVVTQYFHNPTDAWLEGIYVFPLPQNAAVDTLEVRIGERVIVGEIKERHEAKKIYEKAKAAGKKAALLQQERPNIFTTSVAGIHPQGTVGIRIEYQRELTYRDGVFSLRFPMVVAPRYIPGDAIPAFSGRTFAPDTDQVPDGSRITPPVADPAARVINPVSLRARINAGVAISASSPSHVIDVSETGEGVFEIAPALGAVPADRDFVLNWRPALGEAPKAALFTEVFEGEQYALLMVMPPDIAVAFAPPLNREVVFVLDTSGSMSGWSFYSAIRALRVALERLDPGDTFNVIAFSSQARQLFRTALPATSKNIAKAISSLESLDAEGGTEMLSALKLALRNTDSHERVRQVVFITDGAVGNESRLFDYISRRIGKSRLFTVGIGSAPNGHFMKRAAVAGRGTYTYIGTAEEVHEKMSTLFTRLETPMLTDIRLHWQGQPPETYPAPLPDLYAGEPLVVVVKAKDLGRKLSITGMRSGKPWRQSVSLEDGIAKSGVARLYARRKIESFSLNASDLQAALGYEDTRKYLRQKIIETGLRYHLVTRHTSLVAVEDESTRPEETPLKAWPVPTHLPAGWELEEIWLEKPLPDATASSYVLASAAPKQMVAYEKRKAKNENQKRKAERIAAAQTMMAAHLPRTATPASLFMIIGLLLLITAFFLRRRIRARW